MSGERGWEKEEKGDLETFPLPPLRRDQEGGNEKSRLLPSSPAHVLLNDYCKWEKIKRIQTFPRNGELGNGGGKVGVREGRMRVFINVRREGEGCCGRRCSEGGRREGATAVVIYFTEGRSGVQNP